MAVFAALFQPVPIDCTGTVWDQIQQAGSGMVLPSGQLHDAGALARAASAPVLMVPDMLIHPQHPHLRKTGGVIGPSLQARLDVAAHRVPRGTQLTGQADDGDSPQSVADGSPARLDAP